MLPYFWYMLKVIICSGILFGYYWLFLRNKIFHQYNRFYLLAAMSLSLVLPLLKINFWQQDSQQSQAIRVLQAISVGDEYMNNIVITATKTNWSLQQLYPLVYWLVSIIFFLVMLRTLFLIRTLLKKYPVQLIDKISFVNTNDNSTPFSFLKYIFWNSSIDMGTPTGRQIFKHEVAHIQEKHTYDKLFVNIILVFCWCNPFFWLYRKELNMIHEFIADKKAVEDSDTAAFAAMILQAAYPKHRFELTNNFFFSPIKRRLMMLTKNNNPRVNYIARMMVLPLAVLVFAAFTFKAKTAKKIIITPQNSYYNISNKLPGLSDTIPARIYSIYINVKHADSTYLKTDEFKNKALVIVDSKEVGNVGNNYIEEGIAKYSTMVVYNPSEAKKIYGEKGRYGAIKLTQKDAISIRAGFIFFDDKTKSIELPGANTTIKGDLSNALIYIDGKIATPAELNTIQPGKISSVNVLQSDNLDGIIDSKGKTSIINVSLKPDDLPEVVVVSTAGNKQTPVAIALDKMNVFYIGVDNPVTIAMPDVPNDKLLVNIDNGSITGSNGKYIVRVTHIGEATIKVATIKNDQRVVLSTQTFRVKRMPDPVDGNLPTDFDLKYKLDSSIYGLKEKQKLLQEQQLKAKQDFTEKQVQMKAASVEFEKAKFAKQKFLSQQNNLIFTQVEVTPQFTGGEPAWRNYLQKNLKANTPVDEGWKAGKYTIMVKFIVHIDGTVSDITTENYDGSKTALHCIEVIKNAPKWQPAVQNGRKVNAYKKQPITFVIEE